MLFRYFPALPVRYFDLTVSALAFIGVPPFGPNCHYWHKALMQADAPDPARMITSRGEAKTMRKHHPKNERMKRCFLV